MYKKVKTKQKNMVVQENTENGQNIMLWMHIKSVVHEQRKILR